MNPSFTASLKSRWFHIVPKIIMSTEQEVVSQTITFEDLICLIYQPIDDIMLENSYNPTRYGFFFCLLGTEWLHELQ